MTDLFELGKKGLASQPFSDLLGIELNEFKEGYAELNLPIRDELLQQHGYVHGGVIGTLADNSLAFVAGSVFGINVVTSEYKINFLSPSIGDLLVAKASVISTGKHQAVCKCKVFSVKDNSEKLVAVAQGTISKV